MDMTEDIQIRQLLVNGEIRLAGYYLNKYPDHKLLKIWKAVLEHEYPKLHELLQTEALKFQLDLMKFVAKMLCDLAVALSVNEVQYYLGPYKQQIVDLFDWELKNGFYILKDQPKSVLTLEELKDINNALLKVNEE